MKNKIAMAACMIWMVSSSYATSCCTTAASCEQTCDSVAMSTEEAVFVSQLSSPYFQAFNLMSIEQRHEALETAKEEALDADTAIDTILKKYQLAVVDGALKSMTAG